MRDPGNTPTIAGYLLAVAVSVLSVSVSFTVYAIVSVVSAGSPASDVAAVLVIYGGFSVAIGFAVATPLACVAVPVIHLLCRDLPLQWMHVLVTGAVSFALVLAVLLFLVDGGAVDALLLLGAAGIVGAATMVGRASVIPLVRRRQRTPVRFERSNWPFSVE